MTEATREKPPRVLIVCSHGGHLTEILQLIEAFDGCAISILTHSSAYWTEEQRAQYDIHEVKDHPAQNLIFHLPGYFARVALAFTQVVRDKRPVAIVSSGAEIAIPCCYLARLNSIRVIFIDSLCRVDKLSRTAKIVKPACSALFVQWPALADESAGIYYSGAVV